MSGAPGSAWPWGSGSSSAGQAVRLLTLDPVDDLAALRESLAAQRPLRGPQPRLRIARVLVQPGDLAPRFLELPLRAGVLHAHPPDAIEAVLAHESHPGE